MGQTHESNLTQGVLIGADGAPESEAPKRYVLATTRGRKNKFVEVTLDAGNGNKVKLAKDQAPIPVQIVDPAQYGLTKPADDLVIVKPSRPISYHYHGQTPWYPSGQDLLLKANGARDIGFLVVPKFAVLELPPASPSRSGSRNRGGA